ncbi:MAG: bifunctional methylenetetrahydrofolate dehydrogenase/methenyltetrahydrofolate cyclohydrolase FolD [Pseudomonadota bacterium]
MSAAILDGKALAQRIRGRLQAEVATLTAQGRRRPGLAVVLLGQHPASAVYVRNKHQACLEVGFHSEIHALAADTPQSALLDLIHQINADPAIDGILVQLPLPAGFDEERVIEAILPTKDVDGFHPYNVGRLALRMPVFRPCTPKGVMTLLSDAGLALEGLDALVIGQSNIVGRPMALELLAARCTVTLCHSRTRDLPAKVRAADLVVAAVGKPGFVSADWIQPGAIVIDVGINRLADGRLVGDVDFDAVKSRAAWLTPVPGGVGPMTIASLLENTLQALALAHSPAPQN